MTLSRGLWRTGARATLLAAAAAALTVGGTSVAAAAPAPAKPAAPAASTAPDAPPPAIAAAPANCTAGNLCFWADIEYVDGPGRLSGANASWFAFGHSSCATKGSSGPVWADCASSLYNNGNNCTAHVYYWENYAVGFSVPRYVNYRNLTQHQFSNGASLNDNIRSNNWC